MNFNLNKETRKVVKILSKSKSLRLLAWGILCCIPLTALTWKLPEILIALK